MIVTRRWLSEWIDLGDISTEKLLKTLNSIGLEVDSHTPFEIPENIVVGHVLSCEKHPDADKLSVCVVDLGEESTQIVCGASNVAKGQFVPVAKVGATMPSGLKIKKAKLRGVESFGMICSSTEINLPKINEGILVLDESIGELVLGKELREYPLLNDEQIEIELTANRGDCLSVYGVARDLSSALSKNLKAFEYTSQSDNSLGISRILSVNNPNHVNSNLMYGAFSSTITSLPLLLALRLAVAGESFENIFEALSYYNAHSVGVITRCYSYNFFKQEELSCVELGSNEEGFDTVLNASVASIVGVYQDKASKASTDDEKIIIETSYVHPDIISEKFATHKPKSDWSYYRSSRGSETDIEFGMHYFSYLLESFFNLSCFSGTHSIFVKQSDSQKLDIYFERINKIIGQEIASSTVVEILKRLQFEIVHSSSEVIVVKIPSFRHDIRNIYDIAEEVVRIYGIDNIVSIPSTIKEANRINEEYRAFKKRRELKLKAVSAGFYEVINYVFVEKSDLEKYELGVVEEQLDVLNPIASQLNTLRTSMVPALLKNVLHNLHNGKMCIPLFEIGRLFNAKREEKEMLTLIYSGEMESEGVANAGKPQPINFEAFVTKISHVVGDFELVAKESNAPLIHPYQVAKIIKEGTQIGVLYKLNPKVQKELEIDETFIAELDFDALPFALVEAKAYSSYQAVKRDLSVVIPENIEFSIVKEILEPLFAQFGILKSLYPIDVYQDASLKDEKSLTIKFVMQSDEKTLQDEDINIVVDEALKILDEKLGAKLR